MGSKRCTKGKSCSATCIQKSDVCSKELGKEVNKELSGFSKFVKEQLPHQAEHIGINVAAWKVGKIVGPAVSSYLETKYGLPRETTQIMAESAVQAATAVALNSRHMKDARSFVNALLVEGAAAFAGKAAHSGAEAALASIEEKALIQSFGPLLAGKLTGIGIAYGAPRIKEVSDAMLARSGQDIEKLRRMFQKPSENFSENTSWKQASKTLGDLILVSMFLSTSKYANELQ